MDVLFFLLFLLSILGLVVGLIKPRIIIRKENERLAQFGYRKSIAVIFGFLALFFFILVGVTGELSPKLAQKTSEREAREANEALIKEREVKQQKAREDLVGYLNLFKGDLFVASWYPEGIYDEILIVEVDSDFWDTSLYNQKEKFVGEVGSVSDAVGLNSVWIVNNQTRDKLADYRLGRVEILK